MNTIISDWQKGDAPSAAHLNEPLPTVRSVRTIIGSGCEVSQFSTGTTITVPIKSGYVETYICTLTNAGPSGESDFSGNGLYWARLQQILPGQQTDPFKTANAYAPQVQNPGGSGDAFPLVIPVTNLPEANVASGRALPTDGSRIVRVYAEFDAGNPDTGPGVRYVMEEGVAGLFPVNVVQSGGSAGNSTTACTFTYGTVTNAITSAAITGSGLSPTWARPSIGKMVAATHGTGYYNSSGTFVLYQIDEVDDEIACT